LPQPGSAELADRAAGVLAGGVTSSASDLTGSGKLPLPRPDNPVKWPVFAGNTVEQDAAGRRFLEPGDQPQRRRLAAPGRPEQREELAAGNRQVNAVNGGPRGTGVPETLGQVRPTSSMPAAIEVSSVSATPWVASNPRLQVVRFRVNPR
jgi:hypothetical protein